MFRSDLLTLQETFWEVNKGKMAHCMENYKKEGFFLGGGGGRVLSGVGSGAPVLIRGAVLVGLSVPAEPP